MSILIGSVIFYILSYTSQESGLLVHITSIATYIPLYVAPIKWGITARLDGVRWGILISSLILYTLSYTSQEAGLLIYIAILPPYITLHLAPLKWMSATKLFGVRWDISISSIIKYTLLYTIQVAGLFVHLSSLPAYIPL